MSKRRFNLRERRRSLALKTGSLEQLESKSVISEPISLATLSGGLSAGLAFLSRIQAGTSVSQALGQPRPRALVQVTRPANGADWTVPAGDAGMTALAEGDRRLSLAIVPKNQGSAGGASSGEAESLNTGTGRGSDSRTLANDWLALTPTATTASRTDSGLPAPQAQPQARQGGGESVSHPASVAIPARGAIAPFRVPANSEAGSSIGGSGALLSAIGLGGNQGGATPGHASFPAVHTPRATSPKAPAPTASTTGQAPKPLTSSTLTVYTLDYNDGAVFVPGFNQLATPGGAVDLRAQVRDTATGTYTYSWNTTGLTDATGISGSSTFNLTFHWNTTISTAKNESVTLTVTDPNLNVVNQTYTFHAPAGTGTTTGGTTWNDQELAPNLIKPYADMIGLMGYCASCSGTFVTADTGAWNTAIHLPTYNPGIPPLVLNYDSLAADPRLIVVAHHVLDPTKSTPSQVEAKLTFNGSAGTAWYYDTSALRPGDIQQIALQANATGLSTGRYAYTVNIYDLRGGVPTTFTYNDTATVVNEALDPTFSALGAGWTISGLNKIISATGGVILDEGGGSALWFASGGSGAFTSPAGDFSTLSQTGGVYTRTLTDGTKQTFDTNGYQAATIDRNGLAVSYTYDGSHRLTQITDPFSELTTLSYDVNGKLQTIKDTANRLATFTHSGGALASVTYPDGNAWNYEYDSSGRMTKVTEPSSTGEPTKTTTIVYDSAERVGTITRPDSSNEKFVADQEQGWTNSGTSLSPAPSVLLAEAATVYTNALSNATSYRPDWRGMGLTNQTTDALGKVATVDRDANGLATITVDRLNRITQDAYDSKGNVTKETYADLSTVQYGTYNSFAEPASMTDQLSRTTSYTYDSHGNRTIVQDPLNNVATYTYSSTQPGMLISQTALKPSGGSSYTLWSYAYDTKDRLTTITDADSNVTKKSYDSGGRLTSVTDPNGNQTTYSYDGMNRTTGITDAAGSAIAGVTTNTYDAGGKQITTTDQDNFTATTAYDSMDRVSTVRNPDGAVTSHTYDSGGRLKTLTDADNNTTTYGYDVLDRQTSVTSPSVNASGGVLATTAYDAEGQVTGTTDANGRQITYSYDSLGRNTGETWLTSSGGSLEKITYTYDSAGELKTAQDPNSLLTFAYDSGGRLQSAATSGPGSHQPSVTLTYGYDPSGDVTSITDNLSGTGGSGQGITSYAYDNALRLTTITQSFGGTAGPQVLLSYDSGGRMTTITRSIAGAYPLVDTAIAYDAADNVTAVGQTKFTGGPGITINLDAFNYFPDRAHRVDSVIYGASEREIDYGYDNSGQVTSASGGVSNESFGYDSIGNRDTSLYTTGDGNEMSASPGYTYTYDNVGNTLSKTQTSTGNVWNYAYDYDNRMTAAVEKNSGGTTLAQVSYTYDALGRRIDVNASGGSNTWTVFNGSGSDANPYADYTGSGSLSMRYLYGGAIDKILARTDASANTAWYMTDKLGSVTDVVNSSGTVIDNIVYGVFGNIVSESAPSSGDRFKYTGREYDATTGLYYYHARYYDPATGRFASQDPMGFRAGDANLYRYTGNGPTNAIDPTGTREYWDPDLGYPPRPAPPPTTSPGVTLPPIGPDIPPTGPNFPVPDECLQILVAARAANVPWEIAEAAYEACLNRHNNDGNKQPVDIYIPYPIPVPVPESPPQWNINPDPVWVGVGIGLIGVGLIGIVAPEALPVVIPILLF
jgi:RHS repeat-associated protein